LKGRFDYVSYKLQTKLDEMQNIGNHKETSQKLGGNRSNRPMNSATWHQKVVENALFFFLSSKQRAILTNHPLQTSTVFETADLVLRCVYQ